jgi:ABC-type uncharacterized transport system ATPase subunit
MSKTGIELLEELCEKVELLSRRFTVIEQNTKEILNKLNMTKIESKTEEKIEAKIEMPSITGTTQMPMQQVPVTAISTQTQIIGRIRKDNKYVSQANVKIFDDTETLIKETKTNKAGEWICFLNAGDYRAEYFLQGIVNSTFTFKINPDQKIFRVPLQEAI